MASKKFDAIGGVMLKRKEDGKKSCSAYTNEKDRYEIVKLIEPTVNILFFMKPKMNIKAQEDKKKFF